MRFSELREELTDFYGQKLHTLHEKSMKQCEEVLNREISLNTPAIMQKTAQYALIAENVIPVIYRHTLLFGEVCANEAREGPDTMGNWTYRKNRIHYREYGKAVLEEKNACTRYPLYSFCGEFGDEYYHFAFENEKILQYGFRGIHERVCRRLSETALSDKERDWLEAVKAGCLAVRRVARRFAEQATNCAETARDDERKAHYLKIAETAARIPWEKPETFYEALETVFFLQQVIPALEGGGLYSVGRLDVLLYPFYKDDIAAGRITQDEVYGLICEFLLLFDLRIPHDLQNQRDSLVNAVYTLGGIDGDGKPVFNPLTELFLKADSEENIIYPKIKCRFGTETPKEYFDLINTELMHGKSTILYENDGALIPALERAGIQASDARNYSLLGCWEPVIPGCTNEHCSYFSALKIFELSVHGGLYEKALPFSLTPLDNARSFEEVLTITRNNFHAVMDSRCRVAVSARKSWHLVDPHPLLSSTLDDCLEKGLDVTDGGAKYHHDEIICAGLPNVIDSLLVIQELCFDKKKYGLGELLAAVRNDWDREDMRRDALSCHFFGDESEESGAMVKCLTDDLASYARTLPALWGGHVTVGYMLFMEMYPWAKNMRATPDGRRKGDFFARGLTPSSLHYIPSVTGIINSFEAIDAGNIAANGVLNITLPYAHMDLSIWEALMRRIAKSSVSALQINCVSREELQDAVKHPEKHQSLIVRVCGYSAQFVSLPEDVRRDFLSRNFFEV